MNYTFMQHADNKMFCEKECVAFLLLLSIVHVIVTNLHMGKKEAE